jgi:hypothetical protein
MMSRRDEERASAAERAYARGVAAIRAARPLGLRGHVLYRRALEACRMELVLCGDERADEIRKLFREHVR